MIKKIIIIDGNSLMHRAFHAIPPFTNDEGTPTGAIHGFMSMFLSAVSRYNPDAAAVAFDMHGPTFRHKAYAEYKAGRKPTDDDLRIQFPIIKELLIAMDIPVIECEGYEADDILGVLSLQAEKNKVQAVVITGDNDALQLIGEYTTVSITKKGISQMLEYDTQMLFDRYGLDTQRFIDLKGMMGDKSDNIPGIPGVGEKTALKLLALYNDLEGVLAHAQDIKGKLGEKIRDNMDKARFSRELATIEREFDCGFTLMDCQFDILETDDAVSILKKLKLGAIINKLHNISGQADEELARVVTLDNVTDKQLEDVFKGKVVAVSIGLNIGLSNDDGNEYIIPLMQDLLSPGMDMAAAISKILPFMNKAKKLILSDSKTWMHRQGKYFKCPIFDLKIANWLLGGSSGRDGEAKLCASLLGRPVDDFIATAMIRAAELLSSKLDKVNMMELFNDMETPLTQVLYDMENVGFMVDKKMLLDIGNRFGSKIDKLKIEIFQLAGSKFNINSPKQLAEVLFDKLGLPVIKKTKTSRSTNAEVLDTLYDRHEIIGYVQTYRQLVKLKGTYVDGLLPLVVGEDSRVHTTFLQDGTTTGRLSSTEPNLQNIPIRTPEGREIRKVFIAAKGRCLIDADYSQIELRVLAHMANDEMMIKAFSSGDDIHKRTASQVFGVPFDEVTSKMRSSAKAVNFGIVYGISDFGLARQLKISRKRAGEYIDKYLENFSGVKKYMDSVIEDGTENGYVKTLYGRRRNMSGLRSKDYNTRSSSQRMAMNAPIQGTAADIIKVAMIKVNKALKDNNMDTKLILQVHDELILDAKESESEQAMKLLVDCMESVIELKAPLKVDVSKAYNWYDAK